MQICRQRFFLVLIAMGLVLSADSSVNAQDKTRSRIGAPPEEPRGIIWFVGEIRDPSGTQVIVDLGDAHALHEGNEAAVFRIQDNHWVPLGKLIVRESYAAWSLPDPIGFSIRNGDRVIYVRNLERLGTGENFREAFLRQQVTKTGMRNGYSTMMKQHEAESLQLYLTRQPVWTKAHRDTAGMIRSASVSAEAAESLNPLLSQVARFQAYQAAGVNVQKLAGSEWESVLKVLQPPTPLQIGRTQKVITTTAGESGELTESSADTSSGEAAALTEQRIESIQRNVDKIMFVRSKEERRLAAVILASIDKDAPRNERQWFIEQVRVSQFPSLVDDAQYLDDIQTAIRRVRNPDLK